MTLWNRKDTGASATLDNTVVTQYRDTFAQIADQYSAHIGKPLSADPAEAVTDISEAFVTAGKYGAQDEFTRELQERLSWYEQTVGNHGHVGESPSLAESGKDLERIAALLERAPEYLPRNAEETARARFTRTAVQNVGQITRDIPTYNSADDVTLTKLTSAYAFFNTVKGVSLETELELTNSFAAVQAKAVEYVEHRTDTPQSHLDLAVLIDDPAKRAKIIPRVKRAYEEIARTYKNVESTIGMSLLEQLLKLAHQYQDITGELPPGGMPLDEFRAEFPVLTALAQLKMDE